MRCIMKYTDDICAVPDRSVLCVAPESRLSVRPYLGAAAVAACSSCGGGDGAPMAVVPFSTTTVYKTTMKTRGRQSLARLANGRDLAA